MESRERVLACCRAMEEAGGPLPLAQLASMAGCTGRQLQRDFALVGISPTGYGRAVRTDRARLTLRASSTVSTAMFDAGYGSVRAFYEEAGRRLGMAPSEYAAGAPGLPLLWATTPSAVGIIIAVASARGLCAARIGVDEALLITQITQEFPAADLREDLVAMADVLTALRALALGTHAATLPLDVQGTAFQARVWQALRTIPTGETRTYAQVAAQWAGRCRCARWPRLAPETRSRWPCPATASSDPTGHWPGTRGGSR